MSAYRGSYAEIAGCSPPGARPTWMQGTYRLFRKSSFTEIVKFPNVPCPDLNISETHPLDGLKLIKRGLLSDMGLGKYQLAIPLLRACR